MSAARKKWSKKKKITVTVIGVLVLLVIVSSLFRGKGEEAITVQTEKATSRNLTQKVEATGKINPKNQVIITPEVTGEIVELPVQEGDTVDKHQLLIKIKPDTYIAQRDRAAANLQSAKANLDMTKAQMDFAQSEYTRIEKIFKSGLSNKQEMDRAESELASAKAQYASQKAIVLQAAAALKEAVESLNKTTIYSPMKGTISQLNVELGERVLGSGFSQGTNLMTVADLSQMEANVEVDENDVVLVSVGDVAKIKLDAFSDEEFRGEVSQIGNSAKTTGLGTQEEVVNFEVLISLHDLNDKIRPGMSCNADIETETKNDVISVPIQSVTARSDDEDEEPQSNQDENYGSSRSSQKKKPKEVVFVVQEGGTVALREVKMGISDDTYIEITEGLKEGEEIVSGPYRAISRELKEGTKIIIKNKETPSKKD